MVPKPSRAILLRPDETVRQAAGVLHENRTGAAVVIDRHRRLIGIVAERDLLRLLASTCLEPGQTTVKEIMAPAYLWCHPETTTREAREIMVSQGLEYLPIVDSDGCATGIVSIRDILLAGHAAPGNGTSRGDLSQGPLTDPLTMAPSRQMFEEQIEVELSRAKRYSCSFCVLMVNVDGLRNLNDSLGRDKGDRLLREFAGRLRREKRASDFLARYGGDEFVLLLPETNEAQALVLAERVQRQALTVCQEEPARFSVSCGLVERSAESVMTSGELVRAASDALHQAKRTGRNRVVTFSQIGRGPGAKGQLSGEKIERLQRRVAHMSLRSREMFIQSIWGLSQAIEARDKYTRSHSENVMRYSVGIAESIGLDDAAVSLVRRAAMIHDIGKIGVPDRILHKPGPLTGEERLVIEQHPLIAVSILSRMQFLQRELPIVRHHHEWWDGKGYPDGISGHTIPRGARVLAVADAFDAITSNRVYRKSRSVGEAIQVLVEGSGSQFDPSSVTGLCQWVQQVQESLGTDEAPTAGQLLEFQKACTFAA